MKLIGLLLFTLSLVWGQAIQAPQFVETAPGHWVCTHTAAPPFLNDDQSAHCAIPPKSGFIRVIDSLSYSKSQYGGDVSGFSNSVHIVAGPLPDITLGYGGYSYNVVDLYRGQCPSWTNKQDANGGVLFCSTHENPHLYSVNGFAIYFQWYENFTIQAVNVAGHDEALP